MALPDLRLRALRPIVMQRVRWAVRASSTLERDVVLAILAGAGCLWLFFGVADEMLEGETHAIDVAILRAFRSAGDPSDPLGPPWLENALLELTALGGTTTLMLAVAAVIGFLLLEGQRGRALLVAVAVLGAQALNSALKFGFARPRPDIVAHAADFYTASFPSGHAMMAAATYLTLAVMVAHGRARRTKVYILVLAVVVVLLIGLSRIYLGVHWPSDVLAGWCLGAAWALACWAIARLLRLRRARQTDA